MATFMKKDKNTQLQIKVLHCKECLLSIVYKENKIMNNIYLFSRV